VAQQITSIVVAAIWIYKEGEVHICLSTATMDSPSFISRFNSDPARKALFNEFAQKQSEQGNQELATADPSELRIRELLGLSKHWKYNYNPDQDEEQLQKAIEDLRVGIRNFNVNDDLTRDSTSYPATVCLTFTNIVL
jgi:hypothetical protein